MPNTTTRILLNHFKWDKEKLMERLYDGDQEALFSEARVINPFRKPLPVNKYKVWISDVLNNNKFMSIFMRQNQLSVCFYIAIYFCVLIDQKTFQWYRRMLNMFHGSAVSGM